MYRSRCISAFKNYIDENEGKEKNNASRYQALVTYALYEHTRFKEFCHLLLEQAYRTKHVMIMMGDDFRFKYARKWFPFMECVINRMKTMRSDLLVRFSTASNYFSQLSLEDATSLPTISGIWSHMPVILQFYRKDQYQPASSSVRPAMIREFLSVQ